MVLIRGFTVLKRLKFAFKQISGSHLVIQPFIFNGAHLNESIVKPWLHLQFSTCFGDIISSSVSLMKVGHRGVAYGTSFVQ